jgi:hypothetical protein
MMPWIARGFPLRSADFSKGPAPFLFDRSRKEDLLCSEKGAGGNADG